MLIVISISVLIALVFAPIGCIVLWKRYIYFGDGLAHSAMLASIFSIIFDIPIYYAGIINSLMFAFIVFNLKESAGSNAAVGLTSSFMVSLAMILSYVSPGQFSISNLLFGNIVSADLEDVFTLICILFAVILFFFFAYKKLIIIVLNRDIALSRGINVKIWDFLFLVLLSFSLLATLKIVGALLVTSLILIPAMIARLFANSPMKMIFLSLIFAQIMNFCGVILSYYFDMPFAPIIILSGTMIYIFSFSIKYFL